MLFVAAYAVVAGCVLPLVWVVRLTRRRTRIAEIRWLTRRNLRSRIAAEWMTSAALLVSGLGLARHLIWARPLAFFALGMLSHFLIHSLGETFHPPL